MGVRADAGVQPRAHADGAPRLADARWWLQADTVQNMAPFVLAAMQLHAQGELEPGNEGRYSAGPLDLAAYLGSPHIADAVDRAVERRQVRNTEAGLPAGSRSRHLPFVVQVRPLPCPHA